MASHPVQVLHTALSLIRDDGRTTPNRTPELSAAIQTACPSCADCGPPLDHLGIGGYISASSLECSQRSATLQKRRLPKKIDKATTGPAEVVITLGHHTGRHGRGTPSGAAG